MPPRDRVLTNPRTATPTPPPRAWRRWLRPGIAGLVLGAAFFWACANLVVKSLGPVNMLHFMVWSSAFAVPPLLLISLAVEGPQAIGQALQQAGPGVWAPVPA